MKPALIAAVTVVASTGFAEADMIKVKTEKSVAAAADALAIAVEGAGAKVFARVNHGAGAQRIGIDIGASELLIFGNPKVGTPAMEVSRVAGLALPLKVLVYEDTSGQVWLTYEDPAETMEMVAGVPMDPAVTTPMVNALKKLTGVAAQ